MQDYVCKYHISLEVKYRGGLMSFLSLIECFAVFAVQINIAARILSHQLFLAG